MKYEILKYGSPILRQKALPVPDVNKAVLRLADDMLETMYADRGLGLAAEQIGLAQSVCVIDVPPDHDVAEPDGPPLNPAIAMPLVMINPVIVERKGTQQAEEGCLSFPKIYAQVTRALEVTVTFSDIKGERRVLTVRGLLARAVQHELDHLAGLLLVDRMSPIKKISLSGQLKRLKRESEEGASGGGE